MTHHGEFHTTIEYKDWPIDVTVEYYFHDGRDELEDPRDVELLLVTDGTGSNILDKLDPRVTESLRVMAFEREL